LYIFELYCFLCGVAERLAENHLMRWKLLDEFRALLERALPFEQPHPTWQDPKRLLTAVDYYSLFLFGVFNPVVRTLRGLCAASRLPRVQEDVCVRPVSLGSFSAAQHALDPALLQKIFSELAERLCARHPSAPAGPSWLIRDSTLWDVLPRMHWALWRRQGRSQSAVRLHLSLHVLADAPARAQLTAGSCCERRAWKESWQPGDAYIGDRYFGEDYHLLQQLEQMECSYVLRLRESARLEVLEDISVSAQDRAEGVLRQAWLRLGHEKSKVRPRVRVVWVQGPREELLLVTNQEPNELSGALVSQLYRQRWQVELFFRWIKCVLGCRHWLAESPEGVATQIYLALIGALLLQLYTGRRANRRLLEMLQFYFLGVATLEDVAAALERAGAARKLSQKN
jgi:hypothetical protein